MSIIKDLYKSYGQDFSISIPNWEIADQGVTALVGPSGSGKTSVLKLLSGLENPDKSWSWILKGCDLSKLTPPERRIGFVFQDYALFSHLTAKENILFAAKARKKSLDQAKVEIEQWSESLNLYSFLDKKAGVISGGEAQRTALARALMSDPQILFLDEPFSQLDLNLRQQARESIKDFLKKLDIPVLLITHDPSDVEQLADHKVQIDQGRLL